MEPQRALSRLCRPFSLPYGLYHVRPAACQNGAPTCRMRYLRFLHRLKVRLRRATLSCLDAIRRNVPLALEPISIRAGVFYSMAKFNAAKAITTAVSARRINPPNDA